MAATVYYTLAYAAPGDDGTEVGWEFLFVVPMSCS